MSVILVNKENFTELVLQSDKPVLVDFFAPWCGPCRMLSPLIDEIAETHDDIRVCKINVDDEQELAAQYKVMSVPTLLVFKNGAQTGKATGAMPKAKLLQLLEQ